MKAICFTVFAALKSDYLSLTFDFLGLVAPVYAILIKDLEGDGYGAYWSRSKKPVFE